MSKMVKCKTCGADVAKSAKVCPSCGAKQKKPHIVLGVVILLIGLGLIGSTFGGGSNGPEKVGGTSSSTSASSSAEKQTVFHKGDTVKLNDINVTLIDVKESNGGQFNKPTDGNVFVTFEFEIDNQSSKEIAVSSMMMFNAYFDDYAANLSLTAMVDNNKSQLDGSVAAGKKIAGVVGYEAPTDWKSAEIHVTPDFWAGEDIVFEYSK